MTRTSDSAAGDHDRSTSSDERSSSDGDPPASSSVVEEPTPKPFVEGDCHSVAAQPALREHCGVRVHQQFFFFFESSDLPW